MGDMDIPTATDPDSPDVDVVVVGAGFAGLYLLHRLRELGFSDRGARGRPTTSAAPGTGTATRAPAATSRASTTRTRFDPELDDEWAWSEKYATQPEILRYLAARRRQARPAPRHPVLDPGRRGGVGRRRRRRWRSRTDATATTITCRLLRDGHRLPVGAEGPRHRRRRPLRRRGLLHQPLAARGRRLHRQAGRRDRHRLVGHPVDPDHRRAGRAADRVPAHAELLDPGAQRPDPGGQARRARRPTATRTARRPSGRAAACPCEPRRDGALQVVRGGAPARATRTAWDAGRAVRDPRRVQRPCSSTRRPTTLVAEFIRDKIRAIVDDPETAEALCPNDHPFGTKRPCLDTGYYETFNLPHVRLVDLRTHADRHDHRDRHRHRRRVVRVRRHRVRHRLRRHDRRHRRRRHHRPRRRHAEGQVGARARRPTSGLTSVGFPNLFTDHRPGQPVGAVEHDGVDRAARRLDRRLPRATCATTASTTIEPTETAEAGWVQHVNDCADITLYPQANSWYMGANVPGKPRVFLPYVGGVDALPPGLRRGRRRRTTSASSCAGPTATQLQRRRRPPRCSPTWRMVLEMMAELGPAADGDDVGRRGPRVHRRDAAPSRPPGPDVGEIVDGMLPGAGRRPRTTGCTGPPTPGPHPVVVYFHGGGWVLGSARLRRPVLPRPVRALGRGRSCRSTTATRPRPASRPRPTTRSPRCSGSPTTPPSSAASRASWPSPAGAPARNLAAVVCQLARDAGGPDDRRPAAAHPGDRLRPRPGRRYVENADGYVLTAALMQLVLGPLRRRGRPRRPAGVAAAGRRPGRPAAGVRRHLRVRPAARRGRRPTPRRWRPPASTSATSPCRGHIHTSLTAVDMIISAAAIRAEIAGELRRLLAAQTADV